LYYAGFEPAPLKLAYTIKLAFPLTQWLPILLLAEKLVKFLIVGYLYAVEGAVIEDMEGEEE
jgi:hypothetical protein